VDIPASFALQVVTCAMLAMTFWASCAGIGREILKPRRRSLDDRARHDTAGVAACVGLGALLLVGGFALVLRIPWWLYVVPFMLGGLFLFVRELVGFEVVVDRSRSALLLGALSATAFVLVALVESMVGLRFPMNLCDDLRAYLPMAHRLLDTYGLDEPWSVRRAESLGGFDLLRALPIAVFGNPGAGVPDTALAGVFLAGLFVGNGLRRTATRLLSIGLVLAVPLVWVPRQNTTGILFATPLIVAVLAATAEVRKALAVEDRQTAARCALGAGLVVAALMSVRPLLGLLAAAVLTLGVLVIRAGTWTERALMLSVGAATAFIAVAPWSFAMWRTVGTPLYPLFSGNMNVAALRGPPLGDPIHRARSAVEIMQVGTYAWIAVGVLLVALAAYRYLADAALMLIAAATTLVVTFAFSFKTPLLAPEVFARYSAPMSEGLAVFLVYETLRSADSLTVHRPRLSATPVARVVAVTTAIVLAAFSFSKVGFEWKLLPSGDQIVRLAARNAIADDAEQLADLPALEESYREALASLDGKRAIAAVDRPFLIDYRRFDIPNLDAPGFMTPDGQFSFFAGPAPKLAELRRAGFDVLLATDPATEVCLVPARMQRGVQANGPTSGVYRRFLDWDLDIQSLETLAPTAVRRFGPVLRIDLREAEAQLGADAGTDGRAPPTTQVP
jgi:hypothetical protein